jgi:hypothetical protein
LFSIDRTSPISARVPTSPGCSCCLQACSYGAVMKRDLPFLQISLRRRLPPSVPISQNWRPARGWERTRTPFAPIEKRREHLLLEKKQLSILLEPLPYRPAVLRQNALVRPFTVSEEILAGGSCSAPRLGDAPATSLPGPCGFRALLFPALGHASCKIRQRVNVRVLPTNRPTNPLYTLRPCFGVNTEGFYDP